MLRLFLSLFFGVLMVGVRYIPVKPSWEMVHVVLGFLLGCIYTAILQYMTFRENQKAQAPSLDNQLREIMERVSKQHQEPPAPASNTPPPPIATHVGTIMDSNGSDS